MPLSPLALVSDKLSAGSRSAIRKGGPLLVCLLAMFAVAMATLAATPTTAPRRVLILYSWHDQMPWQAGLRRGLNGYLDQLADGHRPELFEERIDYTRTRYMEASRALAALLQTKYVGVDFDAVIAESEHATRFLVSHPTLFDGVPLSVINAGAQVAEAGPELQFKVTEDWSSAMAAVVDTLPGTTRLVLALDPGDYGRQQRPLIVQAAASLPAGVALDVWDDFSFAELYQRAAQLPTGTAILTTPIFGDRSGAATVTPREIVGRLSAASAVPVFVHFDTLIGNGAVGGYVISAERTGALIGRIAAGTQSPQSGPELDAAVKAHEFDYPALERWGISEAALPRPHRLLNRPDTVWLRYRWQITGILAVLALQALLILALIQALRGSRDTRRQLALERDGLEARVAERTRDLQSSSAQLARQNEELDAYAHTVAHDLKSPLTVLSGMSQMLLDADGQMAPQRRVEGLQAIARNARKMAEIIDALLLLGSVRQQAQIDLAPLDMANIVAEVVQRMDSSRQQQHAQIELGTSWPACVGFRPWVEQVWANYLSNALKYGGPNPRVCLRGEVVSAAWVRLLCIDHGAGIVTADRERVFAPFTRLSGTAVEGHGVGLSTVKRVVERMGGQVGVDPTEGGGSSFWFTLPAA